MPGIVDHPAFVAAVPLSRMFAEPGSFAMLAALAVLCGSLVRWARQWAARQLHQKHSGARSLLHAAVVAMSGFGARLTTD